MRTQDVEYYRVAFSIGLYHFVYAAGVRAAKKIARAKTSGGVISSVSVYRAGDWANVYRRKS